MFLHGYAQLPEICFYHLTEKKLVLLKEDHNIQGHLRLKRSKKSFSRDMHLLNSIPFPFIVCL